MGCPGKWNCGPYPGGLILTHTQLRSELQLQFSVAQWRPFFPFLRKGSPFNSTNPKKGADSLFFPWKSTGHLRSASKTWTLPFCWTAPGALLEVTNGPLSCRLMSLCVCVLDFLFLYIVSFSYSLLISFKLPRVAGANPVCLLSTPLVL